MYPHTRWRAYVFTRNGNIWNQQQELVPSDPMQRGLFGYSVSNDDDIAVIAMKGDIASQPGVGSAYMFTRSGTSWSQQQKLLPLDLNDGDNFATSVSVSGDTVVIGNVGDGLDVSPPGYGSAYIYQRTGTLWIHQQTLTTLESNPYSEFGGSVSISGETVVVGAAFDHSANAPNAGSSYIFTRYGEYWSQDARLTASDASSGDHFGGSVSISGNTVVVGSLGHDMVVGGNSLSNAGSAYVFVKKAPRVNTAPIAVDDLVTTHEDAALSLLQSDLIQNEVRGSHDSHDCG